MHQRYYFLPALLRQLCCAAALLALTASPAPAQVPTMVKDINPGTLYSSPYNLTNVNGTLFFSANNTSQGTGNKLWKTNGTDATTVMLRDIYPGSPGPVASMDMEYLTSINGMLYFRANDGVNGKELWKSDGTPAGTVMVKDLWPGSGSSLPSGMVYFHNTIYMAAQDTISGAEIWTTDGTDAGTQVKHDLLPGRAGSGPSGLTVSGSNLYFWANTSAVPGRRELWKSTGTLAGIVGQYDGVVSDLIACNGKVVFAYGGGTSGTWGFYVSDGTVPGTVQLLDINPTTVLNFPANHPMVEMNGNIYFPADDGVHGLELWKTDGTVAGTQLVKDIYPGIVGSIGGSSYLTACNNFLYFNAVDGVTSNELWRTDGTEAGTVMVEPLNTGSSHPINLACSCGNLYYNASPTTGNTGDELWQTDNSAAGTHLVYDVRPGGIGSSAEHLTDVNGDLYFRANDGTHGIELWTLQGACTTGLSAIEEAGLRLKVYPNPAQDIAHISIDQTLAGCSMTITDVAGRKVKAMQLEGTENECSTEGLMDGLYFVTIGAGGRSGSSKLIVQH